jgi:hypothetical protein
MVRTLGEINRRASVAVHVTEAYALEVQSRYRWLQLKGMDLTSVAATGCDGTQRLGMNTAQQVWRAFNNIEDRNEGWEREWEHAKFVGSCFAGKGIQKVYSQDSRRRRQDREDRMTRKDKVLRQWVLGEDVQDGVVKGPGTVMMVPRTVEELTTQLEKDIRGEKDWHDKVVEEHEQRVKAAYAQRREQLEQATRDNVAGFPERGVLGGRSAESFSPAEVEERVRRRKQLMAQEVARMQVDDGQERRERFMDRWVESDEFSSQVTAEEEGQISDLTHRTPPLRRRE